MRLQGLWSHKSGSVVRAVEEFLALENLGAALLEERLARLMVSVPGVAVEEGKNGGGGTGELGEAPEAASSASIASTSSSAITKYFVSPSILVKTESFLVLWATGVLVEGASMVMLSLGSGGTPSEVLAMAECLISVFRSFSTR